MTQYISKSALVAEIERLFEKAGNSLGEYRNGAEHTLISINDFLDTLETKEVDLEEEVESWMKEVPSVKLEWGNVADAMRDCAKHFFELGMAVSNKQIEEKDI